MQVSNIFLGEQVDIDPSSSVNNVRIGRGVKIAKRCSIFGGKDNLLEIGDFTYVGMNTVINGFAAQVKIGTHVSIAQNVNIMCDSGPNASQAFQRIFPIVKSPVIIGNHCWIGASAVIMPGVVLGDFCIVGANSYVQHSFPAYSIIGGCPAKLIRRLTEAEIEKVQAP